MQSKPITILFIHSFFAVTLAGAFQTEMLGQAELEKTSHQTIPDNINEIRIQTSHQNEFGQVQEDATQHQGSSTAGSASSEASHEEVTISNAPDVSIDPFATHSQLQAPGLVDTAQSRLALILALKIDLLEDSLDQTMQSRIFQLIRGEVERTGHFKLVGEREGQSIAADSGLGLWGTSDSTQKAFTREYGATRLIGFEVSESLHQYHLTLRSFQLDTLQVSQWLPEYRSCYSVSFAKDSSSLDMNTRASTWRVLGLSPPKGSFPRVPFHKDLLIRSKHLMESLWFTLETAYGPTSAVVGCGVVLLMGGYAIYELSDPHPEKTVSHGIGFPPRYPEVN